MGNACTTMPGNGVKKDAARRSSTEAPRLDRAREWAARHPGDLRGPSAEFIAAGVRHSRRRIRRLRQTIALLTVLFLGAATLTVVVIYQEQTATRDRDRAVSRSIARLVDTLREKDVAVAGQLAAAAYKISPTLEARSALLDATVDRPAVRMRGSGDEVKTMYAVAMDPGGSVVAAGVDTTVKFWNIADTAGYPRPMPALPDGTCERVNALAFQPRGPLLAAACSGDRILLWDTRDVTAPRALPALTGFGAKAERTRVHSVAFGPDGTMLAAAISERMDDNTFRGSVRLWKSGDVISPPNGPATFPTTTSSPVPASKGMSPVSPSPMTPTRPTQKPVGVPLTGQRPTPTRSASLRTALLWPRRNGLDLGPPPTHTECARDPDVGEPGHVSVNHQPYTRVLVAGGRGEGVDVWTTDTDATVVLLCNSSGDTITREGVLANPSRPPFPPSYQ